MKRFFSNDGASLIQVMLAATLMGGLIVTSMKFFQQQKKMSDSVTHDMELNALRYKIHKLLTDDETCKKSLTRNGTQMNISLIFAADPSYADTLYDSGGNVFFRSLPNGPAKINIGNRPKPQFEVVDVTGEVTSIDPSPPDTIYRVDMSYHIRKLTDQLGGATIRENVSLQVNTDAAGNIQSCSLQRLEYKNYCQGPGAIWDDITGRCTIAGFDPSSECTTVGQTLKGFTLDLATGLIRAKCGGVFGGTVADFCDPGEVVKGIAANGVPYCEQLTIADFSHLVDTNGVDCTAIGVADVKLKNVAGKVKFVCE